MICMDNEYLKNFGTKVKYYRKKNKLTQAKLAELLGFTTNYVGMIERGERNTSVLNVYNIADVLKVKPKDFF